jgi:cytochrome c-type biogenesis protein CcmH/NrfG
MDDNDDEQVLRRRILELKVDEAKLKLEKIKEERRQLLGELSVVTSPKIAGLSLVTVFAIVLTIAVVAVVVVLSVRPTPLKP